MNTLKILLVEDNVGDLQVCQDSAEAYELTKSIKIDLVACATLDEAFSKLDKSFDGAIIDLNLDKAGMEGNLVAKRMEQFQFRIPVAIFTGTPDAAIKGAYCIGVFTKGETKYSELFGKFEDIYNTGLTRIMGGRGEIESTLSEIFHNILMPQNNVWISYGAEDAAKTERALLRHTLNHLLQLLDEEGVHCFPEEVYICPPLSAELKTGCIIKNKKHDSFFVVLSPACDLVVRKNGAFKTDRILLVEIEPETFVVDSALKDIRKIEKRQDKLKNICGNNHTNYFHWLPRTSFADGGFVNFRKLTTLSKSECEESFSAPVVQISPPFVKDIVSRFSSFYARQGQPDIDSRYFVNQMSALAAE
jgi:CheY-like chemotaxis protein